MVGCLPLERGRDVATGSVSGQIVIATSEVREPVPYAQLSLLPAGRVAMADANGGFLITGLTASPYTLRSVVDDDGDGRIEAGVWRDIVIDGRNGRNGFVLAGELVLLPTLSANGCVTNGGEEARVVAVHVSGDGVRTVERTAVANSDGCYVLPRLLSAARLEVTALSADGLRASATTAIDLPAGEERRSIVVPIADLSLELRTNQQLLLRATPTPSSAVVELRSSRTGSVFAAATVEDNLVVVDLSVLPTADLGPFDVTVSTPEGNGFVSNIFAGDIAWDVVLVRDDRCARLPGRDCDNDGLPSLPYDNDGNEVAATWTACAGACINTTINIATRSCAAEVVYDCDDDADGQADVTEPIACLGIGDDFDGDGLCGALDPFPLCADNSDANPACFEEGSEPPPPPLVRDDFLPEFPRLVSPVAVTDAGNDLELGAAAAGRSYEVVQSYWVEAAALLTADTLLNFQDTQWCQGGSTLRLAASSAEAGNGFVKCVVVVSVDGVPDQPQVVMVAVGTQIFTGTVGNDVGDAANTVGRGDVLWLHRDAREVNLVGTPTANRILVDDGIRWTVATGTDLTQLIVDTGGDVVLDAGADVIVSELFVTGGELQSSGVLRIGDTIHTGTASPADVLASPGLVSAGTIVLEEGVTWVGGIGGDGLVEQGQTFIPEGATAGAAHVSNGELLVAVDAHFVSTTSLSNVFVTGDGTLHASGTWDSFNAASRLSTLEVGSTGLSMTVPGTIINTVRFAANAEPTSVFELIESRITVWSGRWPGEALFTPDLQDGGSREVGLDIDAGVLHVASGDITLASADVDELIIDVGAVLRCSGALSSPPCVGGGVLVDSNDMSVDCAP
jgi:hypothetical protein